MKSSVFSVKPQSLRICQRTIYHYTPFFHLLQPFGGEKQKKKAEHFSLYPEYDVIENNKSAGILQKYFTYPAANTGGFYELLFSRKQLPLDFDCRTRSLQQRRFRLR